MASDVVTLVLDGEPTLADFAQALSSLRDLLGRLEPGTGSAVTWTVDSLERSSTIASFRGTANDPEMVDLVTHRYLDTGRAIATGEFERLSPIVAQSMAGITSLINGRVPSVRLETADDDVTIRAATTIATVPPVRSQLPAAYGAVLGRVQTLSNRGSLRFTLYDQLHDKAVSCYLQDGKQDMMRGAWDRLALVRGWVKRDPSTGRPLSIRKIRDVEIRVEGNETDWRDAEGTYRPDREPAEVIIRRIRDAQ
jgi:hypothetical protein